jgi:hypothetical protein
VLNAEITQAELTQWRNFYIAQWAEESFALARSRAYTKQDGTAVMDGDLLSDDYFMLAEPVVRERLKQAGVRLAHLINSAAAGTLPVNMIQVTTP